MPAHGIVAGDDGARALHLVYAITLRAAGGAGVGDLVPFDDDVAGLRLDIEPIAGPLAAVLEVFVAPERIPVSAIEEVLGPEIHAAIAIPGDGVIHELVVGILVSNGHSIAPVVLHRIVAELAVPDPPAKEPPDAAVVMHAAASDHRIGAAGSGVDSVA